MLFKKVLLTTKEMAPLSHSFKAKGSTRSKRPALVFFSVKIFKSHKFQRKRLGEGKLKAVVIFRFKAGCSS